MPSLPVSSDLHDVVKDHYSSAVTIVASSSPRILSDGH